MNPSSYAIAALAAVEQGIMHVPALWAYEVANGLVIAARRKRITQADVETFTVALSRLRLRVSRLDALTILREGTASAIKLGLTAYDGAYVDLALQAGVPLATRACGRQQPLLALPSLCLKDNGVPLHSSPHLRSYCVSHASPSSSHELPQSLNGINQNAIANGLRSLYYSRSSR
jgi:predicted nucleic acid-binding protein